jgi:ABC-type Fe3+ transport system permease subunit
MAALWAIPGPILGHGLLSYIMMLIKIPGFSSWLYAEPSPAPNIWVAWLRFAPLVWLVLWPLATLFPRQLEEASKLDGATPWKQFQLHYWPRLWKPTMLLWLAVTLLTLGEISASTLVTTVGFLPLSHHLFQLIHAGADTKVAATALVMVLPVLGVGVLGSVAMHFKNRHSA